MVKSASEIEHVMNVGNQNRSVRATNMNDHSSRSHAIFTIYIECSKKVNLPIIVFDMNTPDNLYNVVKGKKVVSKRSFFELFLNLHFDYDFSNGWNNFLKFEGRYWEDSERDF